MPKRAALLWVGARDYTPIQFIDEARALGVSRRIPQIPRGVTLNKTWVYLAHPHAIHVHVEPDECRCRQPQLIPHEEVRPGVIFMFIPRAFEMPLDKREWLDGQGKILPEKEKEFDKLKSRRITPVFVDVDLAGEAIEYEGKTPL